MSEKRGPFDRVIVWIKQKLESLEEENQRYGTDDFASWINEYRAAIRVLEAAGKVDKAHSLDKLDFLRRMAGEDRAGFVRYREDGLAIFPTAQIRALLETLPGKEEK